jgi:hypothetical protein
MGLRRLFQRIDRERWFVCYTCMGHESDDEVRSIFHSIAPRVMIVGRGWQQCPRCGGTNTKSFAELKAERQDSALWGLERIVKKHSPQQFELDGS